ncbi:MAG: MFS transporter, partial [Deltaproteobacteria bacterium]|nr:MFS transporter [Deltaproteobacteria bacterium]
MVEVNLCKAENRILSIDCCQLSVVTDYLQLTMGATMDREHRKILRSWKMYDWANSAFATTIMAAVLPEFYSSVAGATLDKTTATSYWGYSNTIAMLIIAVAAPLLGAISDHSGAKKRFLGCFACVGIVSTGFLIGIGSGMWIVASLLYIFGRVGFGGGNIFYDSLLTHVAGPEEIDSVSAEGYAGIPNAEWASRISFLSVAVWWALFSIPIFKNVSEPRVVIARDESLNPLIAGYQRLRRTFKDIRRFKELAKFLLAFWLYNDGVGTIIIMAVIFGAEIGIGRTHLIGAILMVQFIGIPCTVLFGRLPKRLGTKKSILLALGIYAIITILGYFMQKPAHFWLLAFLVSMVQGGTQALSRSMYASMAPASKSAEFFGFYNV